jgi:hypothetical protein
MILLIAISPVRPERIDTFIAEDIAESVCPAFADGTLQIEMRIRRLGKVTRFTFQFLKANDGQACSASAIGRSSQSGLFRRVGGPKVLERRRHFVETVATDRYPPRRLPGDPGDREARYIEAAVDGLLIGCLYLPNGNPQPGPKFDYKMRWFSRLARRSVAQARPPHSPGLAAPTDLDIYPTKSWTKDALVQPVVCLATCERLDRRSPRCLRR